MKRLNQIAIAGLALSLAACGNKENKEEKSDPDKKPSTHHEIKTIDVSYMDTTISPKEDFYEYAVGTWRADNPVPSTEGRWGSFNELEDRNNEALREILETAAEEGGDKGTAQQLIGDYYYTYMDSVTRNEQGISPVQPWLEDISSLEDKSALTDQLVHLDDHGIKAAFDAGVEQDLKNNERHALYIGQSGLGLPDPDYYSKPNFTDVKQQYIAHIKSMLVLAGKTDEEAESISAHVMDIESTLAAKSMNSAERRNIQAQYNPFSMEDLKELSPSFDWESYLNKRGFIKKDTVIVAQPEFIAEFDKLINSKSLGVWKDYLYWRTLSEAANTLSDEYVQESFNFYGKVLRGTQEMQPRWKRAIRKMTRSALGEALGKAFVEENFSAESKEKVNEMVDNLMAAFRDRLENIEWMSDSTKELAKAKLESFGRKLGYPDEWEDYSGLDINRDSYAKNYFAQKAFNIEDNEQKLGEPIDKNEWGMPPHMINAYYNPLQNEIAFPAGIMQPPFFDPEAEDAVNYGRMGMVIGHEFTHGFDDQGAQFDPEGLFVNWWSEKDYAEFQARTKKLEEQFNTFEPLPGVKVNGKLTLGENIADLGGITLSYYAYLKSLEGKEKKEIHGFTPEQRYFISLAQIWKINYTDAFLKQQVATNPHSPGKYRVNGPLANMPEFWEAFGVEGGDPMRIPEDQRAIIW